MEDNHSTQQELWVGYHKVSSGTPSITWSQSVDVALCFGWIDGIRNSIDDRRYKIRFTPRKSKNVWSAVNVKKVKALTKEGKMRPEGLRQFEKRTDKKGYSTNDKDVDLAPQYLAALKENPKAWAFFDALAPSYRRTTIWWVMSAKREETRQRRLEVLIASAEAGERIPILRK